MQHERCGVCGEPMTAANIASHLNESRQGGVHGDDADCLRSHLGSLLRRVDYTRGMAKRGYSREFKPHGDSGKRYLLDQIPAGLWTAVKEKARREGISLRALILKLLTEWIKT